MVHRVIIVLNWTKNSSVHGLLCNVFKQCSEFETKLIFKIQVNSLVSHLRSINMLISEFLSINALNTLLNSFDLCLDKMLVLLEHVAHKCAVPFMCELGISFKL